MNEHARVNHCFVDEAGDLTLFNKSGQISVGSPGVSKYFMVGVAQIPDPNFTSELLGELRAELLSDSYLAGVPSMQPEARKTACAFHAKNDLPEVRRDVFARLRLCKAKVFVAIRRKAILATQAQAEFQATRRELTLRSLYEDLVKRLFRNILHKADSNQIIFARHGKWVRREAMALAIQKAQRNFEAAYGVPSDKPTETRSASPHEHGGLQVVDYYLWALQRLYERGEDRFFNSIRSAYRLIMDLDDTTNHAYGEWYSDANPLTQVPQPWKNIILFGMADVAEHA